MSKQINDENLEKLVLDMAKKINIESAAHTAPVYSLAETLELKNVTELRELAKSLQIKNCSKLRKLELIFSIIESMQQPDVLRNFFYTLHEIEWEFFQRVAAQKHLRSDKVYINYFFFFRGRIFAAGQLTILS